MKRTYQKIVRILEDMLKRELAYLDKDYMRIVLDLEDGYLMYYLETGKLVKEYTNTELCEILSGQVSRSRKLKVIYRNRKTPFCLIGDLENLLIEIRKS